MTNHNKPDSQSREDAAASVRRGRRKAADFRTRFARRRSRAEAANTEAELFKAGTPPDVASVRAKSSRHGKSTADKWNQ